MIEPRTPLTEHDVLLAAVAQAVLAIPGVVGLEPTLSTTGPGLLLHPRSTDGVRLVTRARAADCDVSIATSATYQARAVTHQTRRTITQLLGLTATTPRPSSSPFWSSSPRKPHDNTCSLRHHEAG